MPAISNPYEGAINFDVDEEKKTRKSLIQPWSKVNISWVYQKSWVNFVSFDPSAFSITLHDSRYFSFKLIFNEHLLKLVNIVVTNKIITLDTDLDLCLLTMKPAWVLWVGGMKENLSDDCWILLHKTLPLLFKHYTKSILLATYFIYVRDY